MPRGKATPPEVVERIMADYATTNDTAQTARNVKLPRSTVYDVVRACSTDQFGQYRRLRRIEFIELAWDLQEVGILTLDRLMKGFKDIEYLPPEDYKHLTQAVTLISDKILTAINTRDADTAGKTETHLHFQPAEAKKRFESTANRVGGYLDD